MEDDDPCQGPIPEHLLPAKKKADLLRRVGVKGRQKWRELYTESLRKRANWADVSGSHENLPPRTKPDPDIEAKESADPNP